MASRRGLSIFALVLGFSQGLWADFVNFESGQVRPLALSSGRDHLFAVNTNVVDQVDSLAIHIRQIFTGKSQFGPPIRGGTPRSTLKNKSYFMVLGDGGVSTKVFAENLRSFFVLQ